jgi:hypothetical protein
MPISRRIFLRAGTMLALGATAQTLLPQTIVGQGTRRKTPVVSGFRVPPASLNDPLTYFTKATFMAHLNSQFKLRQENSSSSIVTLVEVVDSKSTRKRVTAQVGSNESFMLLFSGEQQLPQATYTVEHSALGIFKLLLVPAGRSGDKLQLCAVINRSYS